MRTPKGLMAPLSICHLAGLTPSEHTVQIIDEPVQGVALDTPVDLVAITTTSVTARRAYDLADAWRARGIPVILGGIHASTMPDEAEVHADAVVVGEAELVWNQVLADAAAHRLQPRYIGTAPPDLGGLARPRYDLIDDARYVRLPGSRGPMLPVQTSRGCPHGCDFCTVTRFWGRRMRYRPVDEVVAEVAAAPSDSFFFTDDNFFANPRRSATLCEALTPLNIRFLCQIDTIMHCREPAIAALAKAGCFMAFVGFESIDTNTLATMNKRHNHPDQYRQLIRLLHRHGIGVYASIILGLEGDNLATATRTADFLIREGVELAAFWPLTPFPGTPLFDRLRHDNRLTSAAWWMDDRRQSLVRSEPGALTAYDLTRSARERFFGLSSIMRRLPRFGSKRSVALALNLRYWHGTRRNAGVFAF